MSQKPAIVLMNNDDPVVCIESDNYSIERHTAKVILTSAFLKGYRVAVEGKMDWEKMLKMLHELDKNGYKGDEESELLWRSLRPWGEEDDCKGIL